MSNADVNEVWNRRGAGDFYGFEAGFEIDFDELKSFGRAWMGNPDQLDKSIRAVEQVTIGRAIQHVSNRDLATSVQFVARLLSHGYNASRALGSPQSHAYSGLARIGLTRQSLKNQLYFCPFPQSLRPIHAQTPSSGLLN